MKKLVIFFAALLAMLVCFNGCVEESPISIEEQGAEFAEEPRLKSAGDLIYTLNVPILSPTGIGIGFAVDCEDPATMYYTNTRQPFLYMTDKAGNDLGSVALTDAATGASISFGAISWDESRKKLWGGTDNSGDPLSVYLIDPVTGSCVKVFTLNFPWIGFCDGIAIDGTDNSIWVTDDVSDDVEHWDVSGVDASGAGVANYLGLITPKDANNQTLGRISGVAVGKGDVLYLGQNGLGKIIKVTKTGAYISHFATAAGRDEDLECDLISFAPLEVLWSKDAYGDFVEAFEAEEGTCICGGGFGYPVDIKPRSCPNPINVNSKGVLPVAILGTDNFDVTEVDLETILLEGVAPIRTGFEDVATPFEPFLGKEDCFEDCHTEGPDGLMDLTLKFNTQEIVTALGEVNDGDCLVLKLTGQLLDGSDIEGEDVVWIKKKK